MLADCRRTGSAALDKVTCSLSGRSLGARPEGSLLMFPRASITRVEAQNKSWRSTLTSQTFELFEVIGFRSEYILQPNGQTFVAKLCRLLDPFRIIADDLPFGRDVLL